MTRHDAGIVPLPGSMAALAIVVSGSVTAVRLSQVRAGSALATSDFGTTGGGPGGGLGSLLGGALAGGTAGSILSGGLGNLLEQLKQNGQGQAVQSWVGKGPNQQISENDLARSIGLDDIDTLAQHTGLSRNDLLAELSRELPEAIDQLTPEGRLPTDEEASRWG